MHTNALKSPYALPKGAVGPFRLAVPPEYISWEVPAPTYDPPYYDHPSLLPDAEKGTPTPKWADPIDTLSIDFDRAMSNSFCGPLQFQEEYDPLHVGRDGKPVLLYRVPRNPKGRTGLKGRGLLGRFGPNHAADPVVTRLRVVNGEPVVEFVAIKRGDNGEWAIPGGMVDPGEKVSLTLKREFGEEAMNTLQMAPEEKQRALAVLDRIFANPIETLYKGYVDDPRNTDDAWMETEAVHYNGDDLDWQLHAGDDAAAVQWMTITDDIKLYASHRDFVLRARQSRLDQFRRMSSTAQIALLLCNTGVPIVFASSPGIAGPVHWPSPTPQEPMQEAPQDIRACHCRALKGFKSGWCGSAGGGYAPPCEH